MKKMSAILLSLALLAALSACSGSPDTSGASAGPSVNSQTDTPYAGAASSAAPQPNGGAIKAAAVAAAGYKDSLTVEVLDAAFVDYEGQHFVVIIAEISWTEEYAQQEDPSIKAHYGSCRDLTNDLIYPVDRQLQVRDRDVGTEAFPDANFYLFEASYMKGAEQPSAQGGFIGYVGAGCDRAVLQLVVAERAGDKVFCEVEVTR